MTRHVEISEKAEKMPQTAQRDRGVGGKSTFSVTRGEDAVPARSRDTNNSPVCGHVHFLDFGRQSLLLLILFTVSRVKIGCRLRGPTFIVHTAPAYGRGREGEFK